MKKIFFRTAIIATICVSVILFFKERKTNNENKIMKTSSYFVAFDTKRETDMFCSKIRKKLKDNGMVSIGDMYHAAEEECDEEDADRFGWLDISNIKIIKNTDEYRVYFPKILRLD